MMNWLDENIVWISGVFGGVVAVIALYVLPTIAKRRKRKRVFAARPVRSFGDWYQQFYPAQGPGKELSGKVLDAIGKELKIEPTRIYPTDRFSRELKLPWWGMPIDYLDLDTLLFADLFGRNYEEILKDFQFADLVGEFIAQLELFLNKVRQEQQ
ncbi:MAG: hypothetical protein ACYS1A_03970 [Planctomycetota bacterium]|jgi:hypothetical protein